VIEANGQQINVDARPSDSIALAVRAHVPILVNQEVMREAGIVPEEDILDEVIREGSEYPQGSAAGNESADTEGRLSLFEDFLQNIHLDDLDGEQQEPGSSPPDPDDQD